ncbi:hypothetical protein DYBT9275_05613 [Dyadobacter sp. CECT 9275]|uniref:BIG2 domain-containing protein n=1 Tax=Dyadobacter helix TaxID=2822344 RepID=A0A916N8J2_9BACT|nr:hypothetical protein [Dyadobacter sp. CECT 9275]CAG5016701.1 hypothetical protein DYBT9275_05613 [Dyadobacter sp. CECT 9275]
MKPKLSNLLLLLLAAITVSCTQNELPTAGPVLDASKTVSIKRGEPVTFTFKSDSSGRKIDWQVTPSGHTDLKASANKALITFQKSGIYKITATNRVVTEEALVRVDSTVYVPSDTTKADTAQLVVPDKDTIVALPPRDTLKTDTVKVKPDKPIHPDSVQHITELVGDELLLTPYLIDSLPAPSLGIRAVTLKSYKCSFSYLLAYASKSGDDLKLDYPGVYEYFQCTPGNYNPKSYSIFNRIKNGTSTLEISMNGMIYKGTITSNGTSFAINWPHTSGIKFTTLTVSK